MVKLTQYSFLGGQLDYEMMGRQDVERYRRGATLLKNLLVHRRGAIFKRPGTNFVRDVTETLSGKTHVRLVPFAYSLDEGWALLFYDGGALAIGAGTTVAVGVSGVAHFTGSQVDEFDWCQCGDVMYVAHRDHCPSMISHVATTANGVTTHTFVMKAATTTAVLRTGRPYILSSQVSKQGITTHAPAATEYYKVSAVFDGTETVPQGGNGTPEWFGAQQNAQDYDSGYDGWAADYNRKNKVLADYNPSLKAYEGTTYTSPWTQSQKITLTIQMAARGGVYPEQIKIYRRTGSVYGLVGTIDTSEFNARASGAAESILDSVAMTTNINSLDREEVESDADGSDTIPASGRPEITATVESRMGYSGTGYKLNATALGDVDSKALDALNLTFAQARGLYLTLTLGATSVSRTIDDETSAVTAVEFTYHPFGEHGATYLRLRWSTAKTGVSKSVKVTGPTTATTLKYYRSDYTGELQLGEALVASSAAMTDEAFEAAALELFSAALAAAGLETAKRTLQVQLPTAKDLTGVTIWANTSSVTGDKKLPFVVSGVRVSKTNAIASHPSSQITPDDTKLTWEDRYYAPDASRTPVVDEQLMESAGDWPASVCVSQQRLIWASTRNDPSRVIMSRVGDFEMYAPHQVLVPDDPIDFMVSAKRFPKVNHLVELRRLLMFNGDAEWVIDSASAASGITYETIQAMQHSSIGAAANLKPLVCNNVLLFAERTGQAVRQYGYQLEADGYGGDDISIFSQSIFRERGIVAWAFQQHPNSVCWCVLSDGTLASLTFNREQNTIAWATHELGGGAQAKDIVCTHALVGNGNSSSRESQMLLLVKRGDVWTLEEMRCEAKTDGDTVANALCLDSMRTLAAGATKRTGAGLFDAATGAELSGTTAPAGGCVEGFKFECRFTSVFPVLGDDVGRAQTDVRCVQFAHLRMQHSVGGKVWAEGTPEANAEEIAAPVAVSSGSAAFPPRDATVGLATGNTRDGRVSVAQGTQWPFGIVMLETDVEPEEPERRR